MRTIRLAMMLGGLSVLALIFLARATAHGGNGFDADDLKGTYAFRMVPVKSFSADDSSTSGLSSAPYQDILRVGVFKATPDSGTSAHGSLSGKTIATIDNNSGSTRVVVFRWTGHYGVNPDGTGVFTVEALASLPPPNITCFDSANNAVVAPAATPPYPPPPLAGAPPSGQTCTFSGAGSVEGPESYAFVIVESRKHIKFIETDNGPDGGGAKIFLTGTATKQEREEHDRDRD
ncbi:MAG: hypothetical protein HY237_06050 [Acidobacteria bacterium]|nr:hypothetical protein [Acidobacteriota bacterium]